MSLPNTSQFKFRKKNATWVGASDTLNYSEKAKLLLLPRGSGAPVTIGRPGMALRAPTRAELDSLFPNFNLDNDEFILVNADAGIDDSNVLSNVVTFIISSQDTDTYSSGDNIIVSRFGGKMYLRAGEALDPGLNGYSLEVRSGVIFNENDIDPFVNNPTSFVYSFPFPTDLPGLLTLANVACTTITPKDASQLVPVTVGSIVARF